MFYCFFFMALGAWPISLLNLLSSCVYFDFLVLARDASDRRIVFCYFEVLIYCFLCEMVLGSGYGFCFYIIAMISAVFFLAPSYGLKRNFYQVLGCIECLVLEIHGIMRPKAGASWALPVVPYRVPIYIGNFAIMCVGMVFITYLYANDIENMQRTLKYNVNHDPLTKLFNRRFLEAEIAKSKSIKQDTFCFAMMDVDDFKKVNDTYGHEAGDLVLSTVSSIILETTENVKVEKGKEQPLAVRWGGEEFIIFFPQKTMEEVVPVVEEMRRTIENRVVEYKGKDIHITITIGVASGIPNSNYEKVIGRADEKLYIGKKSGKNRVVS